ncbi:MAG: DUF4249 family protein [Fidelibacterota bacterium]|nr:MAG: DUF4249 family protein [Candidatus Neomarinimicrobiota bacterium]
MKIAVKRSWKLCPGGVLLALWFWSCSLPHEPGPQPSTIVKTEFDSAMNVFGVLRLDGQPRSSYFYIERTYEYQELDDIPWDSTFIPIVIDATVQVQGLHEDTFTYTFTQELDTLRGEIYTHPDFLPVAGETYALAITHPDFPTITDTTLVPFPPVLLGDSVDVLGQMVFFVIRTKADTDLYDVYILSPADSIHYRSVNHDGEGELHLFFETEAEPEDPLEVQIYGYDANLMDYLTAMITLKPQTYNETVATVTGGYGVFGSVSVATFTRPR